MLHAVVVDHYFGVPGSWILKECESPRCGLIWQDPMVVAEDLVLAYQNYYTVPVSGSAANRQGKILSNTFTRLDRILAHLLDLQPEREQHGNTYLQDRPTGRLLDVGCGSGEFAAHMKRIGWTAHGTEFDPEAARHAHERHGIEVDLGDISDIRYDSDRFDAITARHVVEHVREPEAFVAECWRLLKPGGRLVLITPNSDSLGHRHFGPRWRGLEQPRHLYLFGPTPMRLLFERLSIPDVEVFSSAQGATFTLNASAKTSRGLLQRSIDQCAIWLLQVRETRLTRRGVQVGEDLVAIADKPLRSGKP